jgi:DNA mismatch repair protein MutL
MASKIAALPAHVMHLIAAGEVIDSPAAVVRELAENALDAGASRIVVTLELAQGWIRVADNGAGLDAADLTLAAMPHSTSKIHHEADFQRIQTLGFRGEALHSLAQLAQLEVASQTGEMGWVGRYDTQGVCVDLRPGAIAPGTIVTVRDLFATWPARRQALPPLAQQLRTLQQTIQQLALSHPQVTWQIQQRSHAPEGAIPTGSDRPWFNIWAGRTALQILPQLVRGVQGADLHEWAEEGVYGRIDGVIGLPDRCHRRRPDWVKVAVNGRCVQMSELENTLLNGFRRTLPRDRFPVCFVHLRVPPDQIDWNRHPAKAEIYLQDLAGWCDRVARGLDQALRLNTATLPEPFYNSRTSQMLKVAETEAGYNPQRAIVPSAFEASSSDAAGSDSKTVSAPSPFTAIAQVHNRYILAETPSGVCLIEQHIAHERVLYEALQERWAIAPLEPPVTLPNLSPAQVEQLQRLELEVEPFGEQVWVVRSAPAMLAARVDCAAALLELSLGGDLQTAQVATACRTALRNGTPLSLPEMQTLLDQWHRTRNPRTCPHGRPICLTLEESSLSRFFRRHWVIGKSHGI